MQPQNPSTPPAQPGGPYNPYQSGPVPAGVPPQPVNGNGQPPYAPQPGGSQFPAYPALPGQMQTPQPGPGMPVPAYQLPVKLPGSAPAGPNLSPAPEATATPYDFFMQPKPVTSNTPLPVTGKHLGNIPGTMGEEKSGLAKRFPLIIGGGIALVVVLVLAMNLAPRGQSGTELFGVVQSQQEVIRICAEGTSKSKFRSTRNFAITCQTGVTTNQKNLLGYLDTQRLEYDDKLIGARQSSQVDSELAEAAAATQYDATFRSVMQEYLDSYNSRLTAQLGVTTGPNARELLTQSQRTAELLIQMAADDSDKTEASPAE